MDPRDLVRKYFAAWNGKNVLDVLKLMAPDSYLHDIFWGETCSRKDLPNYLSASFEAETRWYEPDDELITTPNGVIARYAAYDQNCRKRDERIYNGADVMTISDGLITSITDFYFDPDPIELAEVAKDIENRQIQSKVTSLGLSARISGHINRRLAELANSTTVFLDPDLTVRQLAEVVGCSVAHLFHVLEDEKQTTFVEFVNDSRVSHATTLLDSTPAGMIDMPRIARQSGFEDVEAFAQAFQSNFDMTAEEYSQQIDTRSDCQQPAESYKTG
jgi:AraC-like DNA-binding protein